MGLVLWVFIFLQGMAFASPTRTVFMKEGDIAQIFVAPGNSTLLKFDSFPEPGLVGDQDAFKIEYMKNIVAIKPLVSRARTNLFVFTKEGQFGFQLIAGSHHDNVVMVKRYTPPPPAALMPYQPRVTAIEDMESIRIGKSATVRDAKVVVDSILAPRSRSSYVIRFRFEQWENRASGLRPLEPDQIKIALRSMSVPIVNTYLEKSRPRSSLFITQGLLLLRRDAALGGGPLTLQICLRKSNCKESIAVTFDAESQIKRLSRRR